MSTRPGTSLNAIRAALEALDAHGAPSFIMTAAFEGKRTGMIVRSVQRCSDEPQLLCVAARKGHSIEPLIRDSHHFVLCKVGASERLLLRKFSSEPPALSEEGLLPGQEGDPFDSLRVTSMVSGAPVLARSPLVFDCEVVRHFDLESDHELYIGLVQAARYSEEG
ncbi:MAG: flavin reductase family protein [Phycisphaerales bacterium]|nr:flavin reductase family protein [Phycisphaerales bacterium]